MIADEATLTEIVRAHRRDGRRVVLGYGVHPVLHPASIRQLRSARAHGDVLVVAVAADVLVGPDVVGLGLDEEERAEQTASLAFVDHVVITGRRAAELAGIVDVDVLVVDRDGLDSSATEGLDELTIAVHDVDPAREHWFAASGTDADEIRTFLSALRARWDASSVAGALRSLSELRVLVLGDLIVDEYAYCRVLGTVTKYPVLSAVYQDSHVMPGGGAAIARHAKQLAGSVHYVATCGAKDDHGQAVTELLRRAGVTASIVPRPDAHTVTKRRYITGGYPNLLAPRLRAGSPPSTRLFEVNYLPADELEPDVEAQLLGELEAVIDAHDVVIVADFGHGLVSDAVATLVRDRARWWSVNAQTNSANFGFNRVTRHRGADFVCIDELEARMPSGRRRAPLDDVAADLRAALASDALMITRGAAGIVLYDGEHRHDAPAMARRIVDTVGAGDAVLTCTSLCRAAGVDPDLTVFLGACAGAIASGIVGNEEAVHADRLLAYAESALA